MAKELGAESFALDMEFLIGEYGRKLAEEDTEEGKKRLTELLEACKSVNGKSLSDLLTLVDTGAFNNVISAYCMKAMQELGKSDDECEEVLEKLNELYDYDADSVVIPMLTVETEEDEEK